MSKYYKPIIEEFHKGFEYAYLAKKGHGIESHIHIEEKIWIKTNNISEFDNYDSSSIDIIEDCLKLKDCPIRVKYLDKEDIISLGFKEAMVCDISKEEEPLILGFTIIIDKSDKSIYNLILKENNKVVIWLQTIYNDITYNWVADVLFNGKIKNKSELTTLLKQLDILKQ